MGVLSYYATDALLDHTLKTTPLSVVAQAYVGLHVGDPTASGAGGSECSGNGYARVAISFGAAASRVVTQDAVSTFPAASGAWGGTVTHYTLWDASTAGNMLGSGSLNASKDIASGNTPSIASGDVIVTLAAEISDYLANAWLDHLFNNTAYSVPTNICVALIETTPITSGMTGSTIDELDMTGYGRITMNNWDTAVNGVTANTDLIDFTTLTNTTETVVSTCLCDAATVGNMLLYDTSPNQPIADGDDVEFAVGAWDITVDS